MSESTEILIVDDDPDIVEILTEFLEEKDYQVRAAFDGTQMFQALKQGGSPELIILDVMLPDTDGLTLCKKLREFYDKPILMLSAAAAESDRVVGLELGADDYLPKPFSLSELHARIIALLRRHRGYLKDQKSPGSTRIVYSFDDWILDTDKRQLIQENAVVRLSPVEYDLLQVFVRHPQQQLSREQLSDLCQRRDDSSLVRTIDSQIRRLRKKLELDSKRPKYIKTVRNLGYIFEADVKQKEIPIILD